MTAHAPGWQPACAPIGDFGARLVPELHVEGVVVLAQPGGRYGAVLSERLLELSRPPAPELNGRATAPSA